jgi:hypothetical protein
MANTCRVCRHADRTNIDMALQRGIPLRRIAGQYGTTKSGLHRHKGHALERRSPTPDAADTAHARRQAQEVRTAQLARELREMLQRQRAQRPPP